MKVKDLIKELEKFNGELEVCRSDSENGDQLIKEVKEAQAISPSISYIVIK